MRPTKLTEKVRQIILDVIRTTGSEARAREAVNVSVTAYSAWKAKLPEFKDAIQEAKDQYYDDRKARVVDKVIEAEDLIIDRFLRQLKGEQKRVTHKKETRVRRVNGKEIPVEDDIQTYVEVDESPFAPMMNELCRKILASIDVKEEQLRVILELAKPPEGANDPEPGDEDL